MEPIMSDDAFDKDYPFINEKYAITVCRIEPENNTHLILPAFYKQSEMDLVMIGNWRNSHYGIQLLHKYGQYSHIHLLDPVYDVKKINRLRSLAVLYIHGHSAGGTNPSLVEAMFLGLPIFAFDCIFNKYTTENQCAYWSDTGELYHHISCLDDNELNIIGKKMKSIAERKYRWNIIAGKYEALYPSVIT
jgi:glycosyltransferase involved in cell wall biosynthesis